MKHPQTLFEPMLRKLLTAIRKRLMPWIILTPDTSGDEPVLHREQELPPVRKIEISGMWHVIADFNADTDHWAVSAAESLLPALDITCRRGRLRIRMKKVDSLPAAPELRLQLCRLPQRITMSGMSMLRGKSGTAEKLQCRVDGMSELQLKSMPAGDAPGPGRRHVPVEALRQLRAGRHRASRCGSTRSERPV